MFEIENDRNYYQVLRAYLDGEKTESLENAIMQYELDKGHNIFGFNDNVLDKKLKELGY